MKLIVGLGNPGSKYAHTRHNVGWEVIDRLADKLDVRVITNRSHGLTGQCFYGGEKLLLIKPLTYMNLSGECVGPLMDYYKLEPEDVIVICDDVNLPLGQLRVRGKGSPGGHNGLENIIYHLQSQDFPRIRCGVGPQPLQMDLVDFVLSHFTAEEDKLLIPAEEKAAEAALCLIQDGLPAAMNQFNQRIKTDGKEL